MKKSSKILLTSVAIIGVISACGYYGLEYFTTGASTEKLASSVSNADFSDTFVEDNLAVEEAGNIVVSNTTSPSKAIILADSINPTISERSMPRRGSIRSRRRLPVVEQGLYQQWMVDAKELAKDLGEM